MSRLRKVPSHQCMTCRRTSYASDAERSMIALHRMEHGRADRRRAQWRAYQDRKRQAEHERPAGYLHNVGCGGKHYTVVKGCRPIPVYRREEAA
jgi:hypothetical protein